MWLTRQSYEGEEVDGKTKDAQRTARERDEDGRGRERGEHGQVAKAQDRKRKRENQNEEDDLPLLLLVALVVLVALVAWLLVSRTANVPVMWASTVANTTSAR